jgi:tape measure domain-containing protein
VATHTFQIVVTQSGAQATAAAIGQVGASAQKSASALQFFRQALVVASTIRAATGLVDIIDAATRMDNRLRVATKSLEEFNRAQQFVSQISRQTRTDIEGNAITYARLLRSTEGLGYSTEYLEKVMKGLALSVKVGGATSMEARNSMIQFTQSLASGALRGDELRSVAEQLPALATAIGKEFGISGGQLIAFAKANPGILETERVIKAVAAAAPELQKEFDKTLPTIEEGFIAIRTGAIEMFGDINRGTGIFGGLSRALTFVGNNLNIVVAAAAALVAVRYAATMAGWISASSGALGAFISLAGGVRSLSSAMALMQAAFLVNPITVWVAAIAAAGVALVALYNNVPAVKRAIDGLYTAFTTIVDAYFKMVSAIGDSLPSWFTFSNVIETVGKTIALLIAAFTNIITFAFVPFVVGAEVVARALNALGLASNETVHNMAVARTEIVSYAQSLLDGGKAANDAGAAVKGASDSIVGMVNPLASAKTGTDAAKTAAADLAEEIKKVDTGYRMAGEGLLRAGTAMKSSEDGFNNLARVSKDWAKYTTDAGTAVTNTAAASTAAKAPTDQLGGSMSNVNKQASGAATASRTLASAMQSSAESSTTAAKQVKDFADFMAQLNPLMVAAKAAGEAAAAGFNAAGNAANDSSAGIRNLAAAYRELAAAKAAAGSGGSGSGSGSAPVEKRAGGGPVLSGSTYLVGERGPELFTAGATGNIIPNHALQSNGTTAANDNTVLIVKAINRMANAVVASNKMAASANNQVAQEIAVQNDNSAKMLRNSAVAYQNSQSFKGTGYSLNSSYVSQSVHGFEPGGNNYTDDPRNLSSGYYYYVNAGKNADGEEQYALPGDYAQWMKENKVLQGDDAYRENMTDQYGPNYSGSYDANDPYASQALEANAKLALLQAALERYGLDAFAYSNIDILGEIEQQKELVNYLAEKSDAAVAALKTYREAGANYDQFQAALPEMMKVASKIQDFQTLTPWQGGKDYGTNDPYGLANAPRPDAGAVDVMQSAKGTGAQDNRVQVSMTVNTPNAESFRQNKAQIESQVASMVDRANRRAGRR